MKDTERRVVRRPWVVVALTLVVVGMFSTCAENRTGRNAELGQALGPARERWASRVNDMAGYDLTVSIGCFCPEAGEYVLHVRNGALEAVDSRRPNEPSDAHTGANLESYTVDGLFRTIDQALASNAEVVEAIFDVNYGYPIAIKVDDSKSVFDDELTVTASLVAVPREAQR